MTITALISLRETFEASLVVCVVLTFLTRIQRRDFLPAVWLGVLSGVALSIAFAVLLTIFAGSLPTGYHEYYEGFMLLTAALLLLWMIVWMAGAGRTMKGDIERTAALHVAGGSFFGIFLISFTAAAREGAEMALMVHATLISTGQPMHAIAGVGLGITSALLFAALLIRGIKLIPMRIFFSVTTVLLILLGSSLAMKGTHELMEGFEKSEHAAVMAGEEEREGETPIPGIATGILYAGSSLLLWRKRGQNA